MDRTATKIETSADAFAALFRHASRIPPGQTTAFWLGVLAGLMAGDAINQGHRADLIVKVERLIDMQGV